MTQYEMMNRLERLCPSPGTRPEELTTEIHYCGLNVKSLGDHLYDLMRKLSETDPVAGELETTWEKIVVDVPGSLDFSAECLHEYAQKLRSLRFPREQK